MNSGIVDTSCLQQTPGMLESTPGYVLAVSTSSENIGKMLLQPGTDPIFAIRILAGPSSRDPHGPFPVLQLNIESAKVSRFAFGVEGLLLQGLGRMRAFGDWIFKKSLSTTRAVHAGV